MELSKFGMRTGSCWSFHNLTSWPHYGRLQDALLFPIDGHGSYLYVADEPSQSADEHLVEAGVFQGVKGEGDGGHGLDSGCSL